jgi:hypothetical protein
VPQLVFLAGCFGEGEIRIENDSDDAVIFQTITKRLR